MSKSYGVLASEAEDAFHEAQRVFRGVDGKSTEEQRALAVIALATATQALVVAQQAEAADRRR
ncbi:hypothetical protein [Prauserella rugosa]|uniref:Uncharacterized protein n=1 Tax=Prauserella rugosa TaxID=43354 RepID=A0A660C3Q5_9PSEU|nr:hypothetical protein [Prauserella rugosa]KMS92667.1 hypothetical protein ACZ91_03100 [Streptomyces regensis]TWH15994.1 hypothetical protein JD82_04982 [Prauserella rugosa]